MLQSPLLHAPASTQDDAGWLERTAAWLRRHPVAPDGLGALLLAAGTVFSSGSVGYLVIFAGLGLTLPLAFRRTAPVVVMLVVTVSGLALLAGPVTPTPALVGVLLTIYSVVVHGPRWACRAVLALGLLGAALAGVKYGWLPTGLPHETLAVGVTVALLVLVSWMLGRLRRVGVQHVTALGERARLLELERDQQAQIAAAAERARIAREMHDVVAHSLSVVVAQADGGRYAARADAEAAVRALETIAATGRQALTDMRALLGVLRDDGASGRRPQPGAGDVRELVADVRGKGLAVDLVEEGTPRAVAPGPGLAAYRIVQEALTNVLKHAGPGARVDVLLRWHPDRLELVVDDDGRGAGAEPAPPGGQGLVGMRERAALVGGSIEAGPARSGGWRVRALLPDGGQRLVLDGPVPAPVRAPQQPAARRDSAPAVGAR